MDKLIDFLQKEVPEYANNLNSSINCVLEIIEQTRTAIDSKYMTMAKTYFKNLDSNEIIRNFQNAEKQLENMQNIVYQFLTNDLESDFNLSEEILIEENDTDDIAEDEEEEIEENEGKVDYKKYLVDNTKPYPLSSDFENTTPYSFSFRGETYKIKTYKDMWLKLCELLYEKDSNTFKEIATWHQIRGRKKSYIVYESDKVAQSITNPLRFLNTKIILEGTTSTTQKIKIMLKMLEIYKISPSSVKICLKSDRHPKHGQEPIGIYKDKAYDYKAEIASYLKDEKINSIDSKPEIKVSQLAYDYFQNYFENARLTYDIRNFLDKDWSKRVLNISYPLLKEYDEMKGLKEQTIPNDKTNPYYAQNPQIYINGKKYLIYMKWNEKMHRNKLEKWISENPIYNNDANSKMDIYVLPKNRTKTCPNCGNRTEHEILFVTYHTTIADINNKLFTRRCNVCKMTYMADTIYKSYTRSKEIENINVNFIKQDT